MVDDKKVKGKEAFIKEMSIMKDYIADEIMIDSIITNGAKGVVNGEFKMNGKAYAFCDMYHFTNPGNTLHYMTSYLVSL